MASTKIKIGHYTLLQTIGVGSFGKVKLAVHSLTGHKVAMKIVNRRRIASLDMGNRVRREIQYLKLLRHPHIIKLYEVITTPTDVIMVLEYLGSEMFNYIVERGKMSEDDARLFFQQIICAVEYCHRHKIVHRDLKPENLLLDSYNNVKIADFGLSNIMTDGDFLKTSCGSPNYAAPEVISGKLYAGPEVDVWSCGVILYVMLCGRLPFDDEFIPNLFKKINSGVYLIPPFVSPGAKDLLSMMLVVDPLKRATIAEIRENPWLNVNLPAYLQPLPEWEDDPLDKFDEGIVSELVKKLNFDRETVLTALTEPENNQIKVSYQLVIDQKRILNQTKSSKFKGIHNFLYATSPPPWNAAMRSSSSTGARLRSIEGNESASEEHRKLRRSSITVLSSSLVKSGDNLKVEVPPVLTHRDRLSTDKGRAMPFIPNTTTTPSIAPVACSSVSKHKARSKWHVGIRSKSPPLEVMLEVYRALRNLQIAWKTVNPYRLRCRFAYPEGNVVKLDLQLYTLNPDNNYLLDFKHIPQSSSKTSPATMLSPPTSMEADPPAQSMSSTSVNENIGRRPTVSGASGGGGGDEEDLTVTSIFPFFDICTKLIAELVTV